MIDSMLFGQPLKYFASFRFSWQAKIKKSVKNAPNYFIKMAPVKLRFVREWTFINFRFYIQEVVSVQLPNSVLAISEVGGLKTNVESCIKHMEIWTKLKLTRRLYNLYNISEEIRRKATSRKLETPRILPFRCGDKVQKSFAYYEASLIMMGLLASQLF